MAIHIKVGDIVQLYNGFHFYAGEVTEVGMFTSEVLEIGNKATIFIQYSFDFGLQKFEKMEESEWRSVERSFAGLTHVSPSWINKK
jgi:hypothetical protein